MAAAKKGTTEWYNALASFYQAQWEMREAIESFHFTQYQLRGDFTDPVEQARDALRAAREKMRREAGAGADVRAANRLEVEQSEAALEQARWDQKLSDMQTAEQLGRISYQTYVRYLERESERMHKMRGKTRQQIDHMNTIDLALQEAMGGATGMFNIGDINTRGLVYQARKFAADQKAANASNLLNQQNYNQSWTNYWTINGTDIKMVQRLIRDELGNQAPRHTTGNRRGA
jgi:hypothetical protein